jgi:hypothetical protein
LAHFEASRSAAQAAGIRNGEKNPQVVPWKVHVHSSAPAAGHSFMYGDIGI